MEWATEKMWAVFAAIVSACGGFFLYERKRVDDRMSKLEHELASHKTDLAVVKSKLSNLKEDTQEIKEAQKVMLDLLTMKR